MIEHLLDYQTQHCRQYQHHSHHDQQLHTATGVLEDGDNQTEAGDDQLPSRRAYQGDNHSNQDGHDLKVWSEWSLFMMIKKLVAMMINCPKDDFIKMATIMITIAIMSAVFRRCMMIKKIWQ